MKSTLNTPITKQKWQVEIGRSWCVVDNLLHDLQGRSNLSRGRRYEDRQVLFAQQSSVIKPAQSGTREITRYDIDMLY